MPLPLRFRDDVDVLQFLVGQVAGRKVEYAADHLLQSRVLEWPCGLGLRRGQ